MKLLIKNHKRSLILGILLISMTFLFWGFSRYPQLNEKEQMSGRIRINEALSFDVIAPIHEKDPILKKALYSSLNWANTNKKGMLFGILFAAVFLTLLQTIKRRPQSKNPFLHSLIGLFLGAPLGVCANCVAPVGQGMYKSGERPETILATIHSSPSLNIIVLLMLFNLFPVDFAIIKVLFNLLFILGVTPLLTKIFASDIKEPNEICAINVPTVETWEDSIKLSLKGILENLWYIIKKTVPLMLLAGALGTSVLEIFDINFLESTEESFGLYFMLSLLGTFLPVPIAFDLVFSFVLMKAGLPIGPVMVFSFTLGMFSIYPFFIIYQTLSKKLAVGVFASIMAVGMLSGITMKAKSHWTRKNDLKTIDTLLTSIEKEKIHHKKIISPPKDYFSSSFIEVLGGLCDLYKNPEKKKNCLKEEFFKRARQDQKTIYCHQFNQGSEERNLCLREVMISHFMDGTFKEEFCYQFDKPYLKSCLQQTILIRKGIKEKKPNLCDALKRKEERLGCRSLVINYFLKNGEELSFCLHNKDPMAIENCLYQNLGQRIHSGASPGFDICRIFPTKRGKENCILNFYFFNFEKPTPLHCQKVKDKKLKTQCLKLKTTLKKIENDQGINFCFEDHNPSIAYVCLETVLKKRLKRFNNPKKSCEGHQDQTQCLVESMALFHMKRGVQSKEDLCHLITQKEDLKYCREKVIQLYMSHFSAISHCQEEARTVIINEECQTNIVNEYSQNKLKEKICELLPDKKLKPNCLKQIVYMESRLGRPEKCDLLEGLDKSQCKDIHLKEKIKKNLKQRLASFNIPKLVSNLVRPKQKKLKEVSDFPNKVIIQSNKKLSPKIILKEKNLTLKSFPYFKKSKKNGNKIFKKIEGPSIGLNYSYGFSALENFEPFKMGKGISSGDFNNDYWPDLAVSTEQGVHLYANNGQGGFIRIPFSPKEFKGVPFLTSFVDIDNDGWQDLFISTYGGGNFFFKNTKGSFISPAIDLSDPKNIILTISSSFSDIDQDGDLDFFQGNWSFGEINFLKANLSTSINRLYKNNLTGGRASFQLSTPFEDDLKGETLTSLFTDLNQDGIADLLTGNDFSVPDGYYLGQKNKLGLLKKIKKTDQLIPAVSHFTMSIDTGDLNNDLHFDLFSGEMAFFGHHNDDTYCDHIDHPASKIQCKKHFQIRTLSRKRDIKGCSSFKGRLKESCILSMLIEMMLNTKEVKNCKKIPSRLKEAIHLCEKLFELKAIHKNSVSKGHRDFNKEDLVQNMSNILLVSDGKGNFKNRTIEFNVTNSFWSWNAKFFDLDNDSWQDIYVGNGFLLNDVMTSNTFFHNQKGKKFQKKEKEFGLTDYIHTHSYTAVDYDLDGDLDIISTGSFAPLRVFKNGLQKNQSISFSFNDQLGNRYGIGNKIIIYYGEKNDLHQIREIKSGGGFLSFDRPWANFGLGSHSTISKIKVLWSTGEETNLKRTFQAGRHYIIERNNKNE